MLLVVLDTARADHFGPYGGRAATPAFDDLASRGAFAKNAVASAPWTVPSHASMLSGLLPFEHNVTGAAIHAAEGRLSSPRPAIEGLSDRWLPEVLRRSGYRTFAVSANPWITPAMGFDVGFDHFEVVGMARIAPRGVKRKRRLRDSIPPAIRQRLKNAALYLRDAYRGRDFGAADALRLLEEIGKKPRPFFGFVNIMEAHSLYLPPGRYNSLSGLRRLRAPGLLRRYYGGEMVLSQNLGLTDVPEEALGVFRELYAGEVAYADAFLSELFSLLGPRLDETVVIVTADHGENLGEEHLLGHQLSLDRRLLHVPMAIAGPVTPPSELGDDVFSLASLARVVADSIDLPAHPWAAGERGLAVAQYESGLNHFRRARAMLPRLDAEQSARLGEVLGAATDGSTTVVRSSRGVERVEGPAGGAPRLRAALDGVPGEPGSVPEGYTPRQEAEIEERLQELGYL